MPGSGERMNQFGRRGGRGVRPYLIMLKIICVGLFLGGLASFLVLAAGRPIGDSLESWREFSDLAHRMYGRLIVPGVIGAEVAGVLLTASIWGVMIRMRWFQLKMLILLIGCPGLHVFMVTRLTAFDEMLKGGFDEAVAVSLRTQLLAGTAAAIVYALLMIWLGRIKPRLGQDYGRTFAHTADGRENS